jgi:hypothetical protein
MPMTCVRCKTTRVPTPLFDFYTWNMPGHEWTPADGHLCETCYREHLHNVWGIKRFVYIDGETGEVLQDDRL